MKSETRKKLCTALGLLAAAILWTAAVRFVDVQAIGPRGSSVGFAALNQFVHRLTGVHMSLYVVTDWLGLVPVTFGMGFAILGLIQWIGRKHILKVDYDILILGIFYLAVMAVYLLFEELAVNYRPVLINGYLEASYPSSTTLLVLCVMPTSLMQFNSRIKHTPLRQVIIMAILAFILFMVTGRMISGVHWVTDIVGGILISSALVMLYDTALSLGKEKR